MTVEEELAERLSFWQCRLRIQDWQIRLQYKRGWEMDPAHNLGELHWHSNGMRAVVSILDPQDRHEGALGFVQADPEETLIHELLHIMLLPLGTSPDTPEGRGEEQAVSRLAEALLALARQVER
jgi:hypothetical protein